MYPLKKYPVLLMLLAASLSLSGQVAKVQNHPNYDYKWIHFGFMVGLNTMDFGFQRPAQSGDSLLFADVSSAKPGFQVSIVSDLRLNDHFTLRFLPGITFGAREFSFYENDGSGNAVLYKQWTIESNFLDFPLLVKYKSHRVNNYRPYLVGGLNFRYDMAARRELEQDGAMVRLRKPDFYAEIGFGIDFFLQYFKFAPELKVSAGFTDVFAHDPDGAKYTYSIERLQSYVVMLCFYFE